jgi:hypothetical protein
MRETRMLALALAFLFLLVPVSASADRATDLAKKATTVQRETCEDVSSVDVCHENFPTGCTKSLKPRYDAFLNYLKNQVPKPTSKPLKILTRQNFKALDDDTPDGLKKGNNAEHADALAKMGQGNIYGVIGYLYLVQVTGAESTNCQLSGRTDQQTDYHIHVGFDAATAKKIRDGDAVEQLSLQQTSIVVEMTPHYREWRQPTWTNTLLEKFLGHQVKVVGQLLMDNEHVNANDNCADPLAVMSKCWRASAWELHPVTEFYVCPTPTPCAATSPKWKRLADMP